jgi:8-oxo-dGTP pyrophosphatase MutT (NUDIX family)
MPGRPTQADGHVHGVIVAIPRADGRLLVIRRAEHVAAGGKIAFPGGAVERGESIDDAARREVAEELGVSVTVRGPVWRRAFAERSLVLWGFLGRWAGGALTPDPAEVAATRWETIEGLRALESRGDALPGTVSFAEAAIAAAPGDSGVGPGPPGGEVPKG